MWRAVALLALGVPAVHELRYLVSYGGDAQQALGHQGHAYLAVLTPLAGLAAAFLLGSVLTSLAGRRDPAGGALRWSSTALWIVCAASLFAIYGLQELLEGWLAPGHPGGADGVLGHGGWVAVPLALAVSAVLTFFLREAEAAKPVHFRRGALRLRPAARSRLERPPVAPSTPADPVLARHLAGRAPPSLLV